MSSAEKNNIPYRVQVSILLIGFAALAWILPDRHRSASELGPAGMILMMSGEEKYMTVDQVARHVVLEDTSIMLIDIRDPQQFLSAHVPGAVNIPFPDICNPDWSGYLDNTAGSAVIYANGDVLASEAWWLCVQKGYHNVRIMKGGLNEWFEVVMESEFSGERITAAENALFEVRYRARDFFTSMNSLPDSLKTAFLEVKRKEEAELTGGCE